MVPRKHTVPTLLLLLGLSLWVAPAAADSLPYSQGTLWAVRAEPGAAPSYIFGTIHSDDLRVLDLSPEVEKAFMASERYAFELDFERNFKKAVARAMFNREPPTLRQQLDPQTWQRAKKAAMARGVPLRILPLMEPWALAITLAVPSMNPRQTLDRVLYRRAKKLGRPTIGLETVQEQISVFDDLPLEQQLAMLRHVLELRAKGRIKPMFERLTRIWLRGDLAALVEFSKQHPMLPDPQASKALHNRLVVQRNKRMARRMQPLLQRGRAFIAVGALHLPGKRGILSLLEDAGYIVQPVNGEG